jgi:hypothetical protein
MKLKHCITALLLVAAINFTPAIVHAQTDGDPGDPGGNPDDPIDVPFDGGISVLVAAGVAYGLKKRHDAKNSRTQE